MLEEAELETNLLQFHEKSFGFERTVEVEGKGYAIFSRTETESESQFRPRLLRLRVIVPREWLLYDLAADALLIGTDGLVPGPRPGGSAREAAADAPEFREQGAEWRRILRGKEAVVYVPMARVEDLLSAAGRATLGLPERE